MKTIHVVKVPVEIEREATIGLAAPGLGSFLAVGDELIEIELTAQVELVPGTIDQLEVTWLGDSEAKFDALTEAEQVGAIERAEDKWHEIVSSLPSLTDEADARADYLYDLAKDDSLRRAS